MRMALWASNVTFAKDAGSLVGTLKHFDIHHCVFPPTNSVSYSSQGRVWIRNCSVLMIVARLPPRRWLPLSLIGAESAAVYGSMAKN
jgi:hypothetical protein